MPSLLWTGRETAMRKSEALRKMKEAISDLQIQKSDQMRGTPTGEVMHLESLLNALDYGRSLIDRIDSLE